ncbi:hypothetical protein [Haloarcula rubripromontorii]|uniref:hypothetical protein n=1 Tax=Haloarcula rubripromontorii TaxID=1705562 RepID=UPI00345B8159
MSPTPDWWRSLPTWAQATILSLLLPGVVAHELTHVVCATSWANTALDWDSIAFEAEWTSSHPAPRAAAHIAPLVAGYAAGVGVFAVVIGRPQFSIHAGLLAYLSVNWLAYTIASVSDVAVCLQYLLAWRRGDDLPTA